MEWLIGLITVSGGGLIIFGVMKNKIDNHIEDRNIHQTHKEISDNMMPRTECNIISGNINDKMEGMASDITEIKKDIKIILMRK